MFCPPSSKGDEKSVHRAIQRLGRISRPKGGKTAHFYVFASEESEWLHNFFETLKEFDPNCASRVRVRQTNPLHEFTEATTMLEKVEVAKLVETYDIDHKRHRSFEGFVSKLIDELFRVYLLFRAGAIDEKTNYVFSSMAPARKRR